MQLRKRARDQKPRDRRLKGDAVAGGVGAVGPSDHYDVVVVGSGFGGSVSAYRLADAGLKVCVLERGKQYPPGSFARDPHEMRRNFWDPNRGLQGLFDIWSFKGLEAVMSAGLGGGSLIYANVLLRKDERWFVDEAPDGSSMPWPISREDLDPHYDHVEKMMGANLYPIDVSPYDKTAKTVALRDAARANELDWNLVPLAVTFGDIGRKPVPGTPIQPGDYGNYHNLPRRSCTLCGECDIGCNQGAKNTLDHTYLSAAAHLGAEIRTRTLVRDIEREGDGFRLGIIPLAEYEGQSVKTSDLPAQTITARRVILGAGALGSTYLLMRNAAALGGLSPALGSRFCGNGDLLGFMIRSKTHQFDGWRSPVITSAVRLPDALDDDLGEGNGDGKHPPRGAYIEDAGFPQFVSWMLETTQVSSTTRRVIRFAWHRAWDKFRRRHISELSSEVADLFSEAVLSSRSVPLLGMGRDIPDGQMSLNGDRLEVDWTTATSKDYFKRVRSTMRELSKSLDAEFEDNPLWWFKRVVTVHALGGAPMGHDPSTAVVDQYGEVFGVPGLYVLDGASMPGPVGANPSLTIAAFADRAAERIAQQTSLVGSAR